MTPAWGPQQWLSLPELLYIRPADLKGKGNFHFYRGSHFLCRFLYFIFLPGIVHSQPNQGLEGGVGRAMNQQRALPSLPLPEEDPPRLPPPLCSKGKMLVVYPYPPTIMDVPATSDLNDLESLLSRATSS